MTSGPRLVTQDDLDDALEDFLAPRLGRVLKTHAPGHCMRVDDIETSLSARLCRRLRTHMRGIVRVLGTPPEVPEDVAASSTKVVELRNPDDNGELRPPLLVFVPPGTRASAEDSFGVATFQQVQLGAVYHELRDHLSETLPESLRTSLRELFSVLREEKWPYGTPVAEARFLLAVRLNGADAEDVGGALCELGLLPDPELLDNPVTQRVLANLNVVRKLDEAILPERQRVLGLKLTDAAFRKSFAEFAVHSKLADPREWTRRIVADPRARKAFAFGNWPLPDQKTYGEVDIEVAQLPLPKAGENDDDIDHAVLREIDGQPYLSLDADQGTGMKDLAVSFTTHREALKIKGLKRFRVQVIAEGDEDDSGIGPSGIPTDVSTTVAAKRNGQKTYKAKLTKLLKAQWEEGWHFVRVTALDEDGVAFPHVKAEDSQAENAKGHPSYESERFYVLTENSVEPPTDKRRRRAAGTTHAARRLEFDTAVEGRPAEAIRLRGTRWAAAAKGSSERGSLVADFGPDGLADIALSPVLAEVQRRIAAHEGVGHWHLSVAVGASASDTAAPTVSGTEWTGHVRDSELLEEFTKARATLFARVSAASAGAGRQETTTVLPVEGADLLVLRDEVTAYAQSYQDLLEHLDERVSAAPGPERPRAVRALAQLSRVDCVTIDVTDHRGGVQEAVLIAPTHPLRILWLTAWAHLGHDWATKLSEGKRDDITLTREALFDTVTPLGFPLVVPSLDGRLNLAALDLTPYWGVCLPSGTQDPQGILALLQSTLNVPGRAALSDTWSARTLALRIEQYLRQHPYVETLVVNAFNVGRGEDLANAVRQLHANRGLAHVGYEIRLFVGDPEAPGTGEALVEELLLTDDVGPKVAVSVRDRTHFGGDQEENAHITLLFDALSAERIQTAPASADAEDAVLPVHGLVQDMVIEYRDDELGTSWRKRPRHGRARPIPGAEELSDLLTALPHTVSVAAARVATGGQGTQQIPEVSLALDVADSTLLDHAHRCSDWVLTVDRTLGVEFFDNPVDKRRPEHVIDYTPDTGTGLGHRVVVSSRALEELRALLDPLTQEHGLHVEERHVQTFFDQLRLLSGRLAFKIASTASAQRTEVLGLALGRLYLEHQGALRNQILVPLDAHQDLYSEARARRDASGAVVDLRRTDLALFDVDPGRRAITCRLVEVKCHTRGLGLTEYAGLQKRIRDQIEASTRMLTAQFSGEESRRPDRAVKNLRLSNLLRYYLDRGARHGTIDEEGARDARWLLVRLDDGFALEFTRTGLVFDLGDNGNVEQEVEYGIEYHRVGSGLIQELLDAIPTELPPRATKAGEGPAGGVSAGEQLTIPTTIPKFSTAAFLPSTAKTPIPEYEAKIDDTFVEEATDEEPQETETPEQDATEAAVVDARPQEAKTSDEGRGPAKPASTSAGSIQAAALENEMHARERAADGPATENTSSQPAEATESTRLTEPKSSEPIGEVPEADETDFRPDIMLGTVKGAVQYGTIGQARGRRIAIDFNETHTVSLFGQQGAGKSYTLGSLIESATMPVAPANRLPNPLATIVFHYSKTMDYSPEFTSMVKANDDEGARQKLAELYGVSPSGLTDIVLLAPEDQVEDRIDEYPDIDVRPLKFGSAELRAEHWRFLMGAVGNQSTYIRQLMRILKQNRRDLRLDVIRSAVEQSNLTDRIKELAEQRLAFAEDYIDDSSRITDLVRPGRLIIVDLRDEFVEKDQALGLFVVLMQLFAEAQDPESSFNKLVVFDEAHKYIESPDLIKGLVESVREMRHKGMSVLVASQDPPSVPTQLIELSDHIIVHKFTSPQWLKHLQNAKTALRAISSEKLSALEPGEAYVWAEKSSDEAFSTGMARIRIRPRITLHGGGTRTAVDE